ncbi:serine/threonine-protein kinase [Streptomyces sp. NPDC052051]|uniref:serine/threonine-protein kinase n=1 Tax=Streptomyces sp. NPDC052051 TaxID=3154649 RepID=UPI00343E6E81
MTTEGQNARVVAGRYRLEERIGRGGMGVVWRAVDQLLGRQVAVKELVLDTSLSGDEARLYREHTLREARAVAQLRHPHIIVVHDVVEDDERPYLVMELIDGGSLAERIATHGPVDAREAARIGVGLLGALRRAHDAGVLHRDLKPANVLVEAGTDRVVLTDFGIAQVAGATTLTESGSFVGSPEYTAPERMSGERTGPESDLWSLGALLCTVLSGASPFHRDSLGGILHAVVVDEIRPPAQAQPILPVVRGLLERDPRRRLDAAEAQRLLEEFLATGRMPRAPVAYPPTQRDVPRHVVPSGWKGEFRHATQPSAGAPQTGQRFSRGGLVLTAVVAAVVGAGVSVMALLWRDDGTIGDLPRSSAPQRPSVSASVTRHSPPGTVPVPAPTGASPSAARTAPEGYRLAHDPGGFSLAVPHGFTRSPQGEGVFYLSPGRTFRIGIRTADPEPGGPLAVMRRADAAGPATEPGYRDSRVTKTSHHGQRAALREFSRNGSTAAGGPRRTVDLCWEEDGRMYEVWVSAPVGRVRKAKEYFDAAVDTFVPG